MRLLNHYLRLTIFRRSDFNPHGDELCVGILVRDDDEKRLTYEGSNLDARTTRAADKKDFLLVVLWYHLVGIYGFRARGRWVLF